MVKLIKLLVVICFLLTGITASAGTLVVDSDVPTENVIASDATGATSYTRAFDITDPTRTNYGRANTFVTPDNPTGDAWENITLTVRKHTTHTFSNDTLLLWVFKATAAQFDLADGAVTPDVTTADVIDTDLTGITTDDVVVDREPYTVDGSVTGGSFVHFSLPSSVPLEENTDYIFLLVYEEVGGSQGFFQITEGGSASSSSELQLHTTQVTIPGRRIRHYIQGTGNIKTASNPLPEDEDTYISKATNLTWDNPQLYTSDSFDLYIRAGVEDNEPNWLASTGIYNKIGVTDLDLDGDADTTEAAPSETGIALAADTTYYWKVISYEPNELGGDAFPHESPTWSFTTAPDTPDFISQPESLTVAAGDAASFSISAINRTSTTWYQSDDTVVGGDTEIGSGDTLELTNVQEVNEGWYYAVISNGNSADDKTSEMVRLMTRRLAAHWDFEGGSLTDSVEGYGGQIDDPNFAAGDGVGTSGDAYELFNDERFVEIAGSNDFFNFYPQGLTVNVWVKVKESGISWQSPVSKMDRLSNPDEGFCIYSTRGTPSWTSANIGGHAFGTGDAAVNNGEWHMQTMTYDPTLSTEEVSYYRDGELIRTGDVTQLVELVDVPLIFGQGFNSGSNVPFVGLIDEVKIFTYSVTEEEVLGLYNAHAETEKILCILPYVEVLDIANAETGLTAEDDAFEPDCVVNMADFAALAEVWLSDGRAYGTLVD